MLGIISIILFIFIPKTEAFDHLLKTIQDNNLLWNDPKVEKKSSFTLSNQAKTQ